MPQFPYAKLLVRRNGGSPQTGGIICAFGDSVVLSSEDTAHPQAFRFEIYSHPDSFACPAGWSTDVDGMTYYYAGGATAPAFTLPASHGDWGDFLLSLTINNGDEGESGLPETQFVDKTTTALRLVSDALVTDVAYLGDKQFNPKGPTGDLQAALRLLAVGLGVGFGTAWIADHAVTYVKIQQVAAQSVIGNPTGSLANAQAIAVTGGLEFSGSNMQRSALTGDVTAAAGSGVTSIAALAVTTAKIADNAVTPAKMATMAVGLLGNDTGTAIPKVITLGTGLAFAGGALTVAALALSSFATIAAGTFLGNITGSPAAPVALTATQVTANLNVATTTLKGLVPAPGTATGRFLNDSLAWATPAGTFTNPVNVTDDGKLGYASAGAIAWASAIKTNGTYLAFGGVDPTVLTIGTSRYAHATHVSAGLGSDGTTNYDLVQWGVGTNNKLLLGSSAVAVTELQGKQLKVTASVQAGGALTPTIALTGGAHTNLTLSTEVIDVLVDLAQTKQWATGALATQRGLRVTAPTLAFVGASTVTTAATVAISGAPAAGTNATLTQSVALWLEAGGIAYGSSAALTGLNRYAASATCSVGRSSTSTDVNLVSWGVTATDQLALGADGAASILLSATTSLSMRLGGSAKWDFSTTQLDAHSNNIVNLLALNGTRVATGTLGTTLADANETLSVAGGNVYEQITPLSATRSKGLAVTGATLGEIVSIRRYTADSNPLQINDEAGLPLYTFPASQKRIADFIFNGTKFQLLGHMKLA